MEIDTQHLEPSIIIDSLGPDNIEIPEGITMNVDVKKGLAVITMECGEDRILTCRSTMDEILMLIDSILTSIALTHGLAESPDNRSKTSDI